MHASVCHKLRFISVFLEADCQLNKNILHEKYTFELSYYYWLEVGSSCELCTQNFLNLYHGLLLMQKLCWTTFYWLNNPSMHKKHSISSITKIVSDLLLHCFHCFTFCNIKPYFFTSIPFTASFVSIF